MPGAFHSPVSKLFEDGNSAPLSTQPSEPSNLQVVYEYIREPFSLMLKNKSPQSLYGYPEGTHFLWLNIHNFTRFLRVQNRNPTPDNIKSN